MGGDGEEVHAAILSLLARRAVRLRRETVHVHAPPDHPFAVYCRRYGLRLHSLYPRAEKFMGRIVTLDSCLRALLPELAWRWGAGERKERVGLRTDLGSATFSWQGSGLSVARVAGPGALRLTQQELMQLIAGYLRPRDLPSRPRRGWPPGRAALLERLFPLQEAQLWWADRF
ncbi:MAG: hypothetical protein AB1505_17445 [Candidatus Latescibacterota bacterium]